MSIQTIGVTTGSRVEFRDITGEVAVVVRSSGVQSGVCYVYVPHTTAAVTVNESADPSVVEDIVAQLEVMVPQHGKYRHMEGNSPAHIKASLMGSSATLLIEGGKPVLGTWQGVFFCEFDGPRSRKVMVKVVPDGIAGPATERL
jgi:secondary thiamine-phosphate synthase enzyme